MPDGVPPAVSKSFIALIPGFVVITLIWVARLLIEMTPFESIHNIITVLIGTPLSILGGSLGGSIVAMGVQNASLGLRYSWSNHCRRRHGTNLARCDG
ncbi:hypothetical protein ACEQPO_28640 [Bacillus sp. SL00103]